MIQKRTMITKSNQKEFDSSLCLMEKPFLCMIAMNISTISYDVDSFHIQCFGVTLCKRLNFNWCAKCYSINMFLK